MHAFLLIAALATSQWTMSDASPSGTLSAPLILTGNNAGGVGTLRIRPSDEDTQLVLGEAGNNASPEVFSSVQHYNQSGSISSMIFGTNIYLNSASAYQRYNTGFGTGYIQTQAGTVNSNNAVYFGAYDTTGVNATYNYFALTGATAGTMTWGAAGTVTNDFRGPLTNSGSATCSSVAASTGALCFPDDIYQTSTSDTVQRHFSSSVSGLTYVQHLKADQSAAGSFGFGNGSYADPDFANIVWLVSNTASHPVRIGNTADVAVTASVVKWTDGLGTSGVAEGTNLMLLQGGGMLAFPNTQTVTCADNGAGTNATQTLDPQSTSVTIVNNDATGCDVTMQETSAVVGATVLICVDPASTATNVNLADVANVFNGAAPALSQGDCIVVRYFDAANDLWLQVGASNN